MHIKIEGAEPNVSCDDSSLVGVPVEETRILNAPSDTSSYDSPTLDLVRSIERAIEEWKERNGLTGLPEGVVNKQVMAILNALYLNANS